MFIHHCVLQHTTHSFRKQGLETAIEDTSTSIMFNNSSKVLTLKWNVRCNFDCGHQKFLMCLGGLIFVSNLLVILLHISLKESVRKKTANVLLCNQAVVDIFHGTVTNSVTVFFKTHFLAKNIIYQFSLALSLHTIILVSIERYLFIIKPFFHRRAMTRRRVIYTIIITWLSSALWIPFRLVHLIDKDVNWKTYTLYFISISEAIIFLVLLAVVYSYFATFKASKQFITRAYLNSRDDVNKTAQLKLDFIKNLKEIKITKIFGSMFVAFLISYLPVFVNGLVHIGVESSAYSPVLRKLMKLDLTFYLLSCLFNPIVTLSCKEDFKKQLLGYLRNIPLGNVWSRLNGRKQNSNPTSISSTKRVTLGSLMTTQENQELNVLSYNF